MKATLTVLVLGLTCLPPVGTRHAHRGEKFLPLSKEVLRGRWVGRLGNVKVAVRFGGGQMQARLDEQKPNGGAQSIGFAGSYDLKAGARVITVGSFGEGRLARDGALRLTLTVADLSLPKGTTVVLRRPMAGEGP
jgi:hypothetical protein